MLKRLNILYRWKPRVLVVLLSWLSRAHKSICKLAVEKFDVCIVSVLWNFMKCFLLLRLSSTVFNWFLSLVINLALSFDNICCWFLSRSLPFSLFCMFNSDEFLFGLIDKRITIVSLSVEKMESHFLYPTHFCSFCSTFAKANSIELL